MSEIAEKRARYVYGVVDADDCQGLGVEGIGGEGVELVRSKRLGAITSPVEEEPLEAGRDELYAHARVLKAALDLGAVLPMRFGVIMPSEEVVRESLLDAHSEELTQQLTELDGKLEMNLKCLYEEAAVLAEIVDESPEIAGLREATRALPEEASYPQRVRLGELIADALERKRQVDERAILERIENFAVDVREGDPIHERMVVNAAFLLEREGAGAFDEALETIAAEQSGRISFRLTGPLPPHSFVELSLES